MKFLFKVFYFGDPFFGFQKQPNGNGIENHIELAFVKSQYINSFLDSNYSSVSRTDKGVHAIMNCFTLEMQIEPDLKILNANIKPSLPLIIYDYAEINNSFNPRKAKSKHYRYYLPRQNSNNCDIGALKQFIGMHDFSAFIKPEGAGAINSVSEIFDISIKEQSSYQIIEIFGDKFGREQIRRMIGFLFDKTYRSINPGEFLGPNKKVLPIKPVASNFLVLVSINFSEEIIWKERIKLEYLWNRNHKFLNKSASMSQVKNEILIQLT